ncbi:hypothetical protein ABTX35_41510, partial [Streptomyces sp. NPDC096080]|uniref:hypothetical protein n=1 Tax=Streptomyces sp. NPDC096080 TaxID=3156693 RepID=UPI0033174CE8
MTGVEAVSVPVGAGDLPGGSAGSPVRVTVPVVAAVAVVPVAGVAVVVVTPDVPGVVPEVVVVAVFVPSPGGSVAAVVPVAVVSEVTGGAGIVGGGSRRGRLGRVVSRVGRA